MAALTGGVRLDSEAAGVVEAAGAGIAVVFMADTVVAAAGAACAVWLCGKVMVFGLKFAEQAATPAPASTLSARAFKAWRII